MYVALFSLLNDLGENVDRTGSRLRDSLKRIQKFVRQTEGKGRSLIEYTCITQMCNIETKSGWCIAILIVILLVLLLMVILM